MPPAQPPRPPAARTDASGSDAPSPEGRAADDRSAMARGMSLGFRVIALAMSGVAPALIGYWIDQQIGTKLVLMLVGLVLGFGLMTLQLLGLVRELTPRPARRP